MEATTFIECKLFEKKKITTALIKNKELYTHNHFEPENT